jgi:hypothetical protein
VKKEVIKMKDVIRFIASLAACTIIVMLAVGGDREGYARGAAIIAIVALTMWATKQETK